MGKYSDFPSQTQNLQFNTPKRDDEHPGHLYGTPPSGPTLSIIVIRSY